MDLARLVRIAGVFAAGWVVLYLRFSSGVVPATEVDRFVHWGLLTIAFLLGAGGGALEVNDSGSVVRRDVLFGVSGALATFSILRFAGLA